jgi:capsular polysaccharide biosynthesis protein
VSHDNGRPDPRRLTVSAPVDAGYEVRRLAGLPRNGAAVDADQARRAGQQLALHPALVGRSSNGHDVVPDVINDARELLLALEVELAIVRAREGFALLRSTPLVQGDGLPRCALTKGLLETIPEVCGSGRATLVESACVDRGDPHCLYSLVWKRRPLRLAPASLPRHPRHGAPAGDQPSRPRVGHVSGEEKETPTGSPVPSTASGSALASAPTGSSGSTPGSTDPALSGPPADRSGDGAAAPAAAPAPAPAPEAGTAGAGPGYGPPSSPTQQADTSALAPAPEVPGEGGTGGGEASTAGGDASGHRGSGWGGSSGGSALAPTSRTAVLDLVPVRPEVVEAAPPEEPQLIVPPPRAVTRRSRTGAPWLRRRGWMVALAVLAGAVGGWFTGARHATSYQAQATLIVQSGATQAGPGNANDALSLAITYSAVIPTDVTLLRTSARTLGTTESDVAAHVSSSVQTGTSVLLVSYTAPTPAQAEKGARAVARATTSDPAVSRTIPAGSVQIVHLPTTAAAADTLKKYGAPIGALLGLALGLIVVVAAERADPRIDDTEALAAAADSPVTAVPGEVTDAELARAIGLRGSSGDDMTIVPLTAVEEKAGAALAERLRRCWPVEAAGINVVSGPAFDGGGVDLARGEGPTILVVGSGTAQRSVRSSVERLRLLGRAPVWSVLVRRVRSHRTDHRAG